MKDGKSYRLGTPFCFKGWGSPPFKCCRSWCNRKRPTCASPQTTQRRLRQSNRQKPHVSVEHICQLQKAKLHHVTHSFVLQDLDEMGQVLQLTKRPRLEEPFIFLGGPNRTSPDQPLREALSLWACVERENPLQDGFEKHSGRRGA